MASKSDSYFSRARRAGSPWARRLAIKRQLRALRIHVPGDALMDLRALRALRRLALHFPSAPFVEQMHRDFDASIHAA